MEFIKHGCKSPTVSSESSSCEHQVQSVTGGAECPAAPPGSPASPPHWAKGRRPVRLPGSGRRGICPGNSAPDPLFDQHTAK